MNNRKLVLENKQVFYGVGFGSTNEVVCELTFNTAAVGYQEIISDPVNYQKMICMTYPLIGNYGMTDEDYESKHIGIKGLIVRDYNEQPSNFRYTRTLSEVLEENNIPGIYGIDTRKLMKIIRNQKYIKAMICDANKDLDECLKEIANYQDEKNLVLKVSSKKTWYSRTPNPKYNVVVIDLGTKLNYIKRLNQKGCNVIIAPYNITKEEIIKAKPDGIFISNGPGNPLELPEVINLIKELIGLKPIIGIGLGNLFINMAYGCDVQKIVGGHHGTNYPVRNIQKNTILITTQNYSYTVLENQIKNTNLTITHRNVISKDIVGVYDPINNVIGVQFEPISPINEGSEDTFKTFIEMIKGEKQDA